MTIALYEKEMEIENLELNALVNRLDSPFFMEAGNGNGLISRIFSKIREILEKCKKAISDFFASASFKKKSEQAENAIKSYPDIGREKVNIPDYQKLDRLNQSTLRELQRAKDPVAVVEKYKKQRNAILGGALIGSTVAGALAFIKKRKTREFIDSLVDANRNWEEEAQKIVEASGGNVTRRAIQKKVAEMKKDAALQSIPEMQKKIKAYQPFVNACVEDYSKNSFDFLLMIYNIIGKKLTHHVSDEKEKANKLAGSKDETDIRKYDKAMGRYNSMKQNVNSASVKIESADDLLTEGVNSDIRKLSKEHIKTAQKNLKLAKKYIKEYEHEKAKRVLQNVIKEMEFVKKTLKDGMEDETTIEKYIGDFISAWKTLVGLVLTLSGMVIVPISTVGGVVATTAGMGYIFADCPTLDKISQGAGKMLTGKDLAGIVGSSVNSYRALNFQIADEVIIVAKRLIKQIDDNKKQKQKNNK